MVNRRIIVNSFGNRMNLRWGLPTTIIILAFSLGISYSSEDYRLQRCLSYRNMTLDGLRPQWIPYQEPNDPCSLRCHDVDLGVKVILETKVPDGTRCRNWTADDTCINGICTTPGCEGQVGSSGLVRDRCGICGGNGSSCGKTDAKGKDAPPVFQWRHSTYSTCSVSCGVGFQTTKVICRDERSRRIVGDDRCDVRMKPEVEMRSCRMQCKRYVWVAGEWSECSRSCGADGVRQRSVFCVEESPDGSFERTSDALCTTGKKPEVTGDCPELECPQWMAGQWSPCSTTCSIGLQVRPVICKSTAGVSCSETEMPISERPCHSGVSCRHNDNNNNNNNNNNDKDFGDFDPEHNQGQDELQGRGDYEQSDLEPVEPDSTESDPDLEKDGVQHDSSRGLHRPSFGRHRSRLRRRRPGAVGTQRTLVVLNRGLARNRLDSVRAPPGKPEPDVITGSGENDRPVEELSDDAVQLKSGPVGDNREVSSTPSFVVSSWGPCSAACGNGVRTRRVQCQVFQESNQSVVDLQDSSCSDPRPLDAEYCRLNDCAAEVVHENYAWSLSGYGLCSRSCAGGTQEATFSCLRISDYTMTKNDKCRHLSMPKKAPKSCNEHRCPPRWRAFPNGLCSASCGGGQQLRSIRCIYDLDSGDTEEVADDRCPPPKPPKLTLCNMAPCPPSWNVDSWSECSVTCGRGIQIRQVRCEQKVSLSTVATVNESLCAGQTPPLQANQTCHRKDCPVKARHSIIKEDPKFFSQLNTRAGKVPLIVGGAAVFIPGTTVQVTCSVRNFNRTLITWHRGDQTLTRSGRVKVSAKGLLRIRNSRESDAGVYTCRAGKDSASINITFTTVGEANKLAQTKINFSGPVVQVERPRGGGGGGGGGSGGGGGIRPVDDDVGPNEPISIKNLLRRYSLAELSLQFYPHPWSMCSKTCGGSGLQSRDITCEVTMEEGYTLAVNDSYCLNKGLRKPIETRDCGYESSALTCPLWDVGQWNECTDESCIRTRVGTRTRATYCLAHNRSRLASNYCSSESRPIEEEECEHESCSAIWRASDWTTCSISCGDRGIKTRSIECVWQKTGKPAYVECDELPRPDVTKPCFMPACPEHPVCRDESKYCGMIPKLQMCRFPQYRQECCYSCSLNIVASGQQQQQQQQVAPLRSRSSVSHDVIVAG